MGFQDRERRRAPYDEPEIGDPGPERIDYRAGLCDMAEAVVGDRDVKALAQDRPPSPE